VSDKNFKVKSGLNIPIASAKILTTDSSGNVSSSETLAISAGGTGQTTAANALNALLPLQTSNDNYYLQTNGVSSQWSKVYNQTIKNAGVSVSPRGTLNVVGATFTDDSVTDTTTITFTDTTGVSTSGGSTITSSSDSVKGLIIKAAASQTANLQEWQTSAGTVISYITSSGQFASSRAYLSEASVGPDYTTGTQGYLKVSTYSTTKPQITVRAIALQSANLTEWQDSSGNILAAIRNDGVLRVSQIISKENYSSYFSFASGSPIQVNPLTAGTVGLLIKGAASQTANLQEWQNSNGTLLASVNPSGAAAFASTVTAFGGFSTNNVSGFGGYTLGAGNAIVGISTALTNYVGIIVKGVASQTADLQQWQNSSGTVNARIDAYGTFQNGTAAGYGAWINVQPAQASDKGIIVRGATSQTADLQQWQNSSGTVLSKVDYNGIIYSPTAASGTNTTQVATTEFVQTAVSNLIDSAPGTLDTLNEIAAALNDDPNFSSTISTLTTALSSQDTYALMGVY
jgi:hypothetical protein